MFKKINRLGAQEKKWDSSFVSQLFVLKVSENNLPYSRFGIVVSKRIDKRAVVRNSLKRKIRSCLEENLKKIKPGYNLLFVLKKELLGKTQKEINQGVVRELLARKLI